MDAQHPTSPSPDPARLARHALQPRPGPADPLAAPRRAGHVLDADRPGLVHLTDLRRQRYQTVDADTGEMLAEGPLADLAALYDQRRAA